MLEWGDNEVRIDGLTFDITAAKRFEATVDRFPLRKTDWMARRYVELCAELDRPNIVELGIDQGGSTAFLALIADAEHFLAFDIVPGAPALEQLVADRELDVECHFEVDQSGDELTRIIDDRIGAPLDLVIDDASHDLHLTTASFNLLFPRVRPGGLYIIEDWSWQHDLDASVMAAVAADDDLRQQLEPTALDYEHPPQLSVLSMAIVLATVYAPDAVVDVRIRRDWMEIRRGPAPLSTDSFDLGALVGHVGHLALPTLDQIT